MATFFSPKIMCTLLVQSFSRVQLFLNPSTTALQASLSITNCQSPPKTMSIESVMPSNHLTLCRPLFLLPSVFPSIRFLSNQSALCIRWPKYWNFRFNSNLPMNTQDWSPLGWTGGSPCSPRVSQEPFPTLQFKSISSAPSFLYRPTLTSFHDYWKNHSLE